MECSNVQLQGLSSYRIALMRGLRLSSRCLGVGALLLAMEAPGWAQRFEVKRSEVKLSETLLSEPLLSEAQQSEVQLSEALLSQALLSSEREAPVAETETLEALTEAEAEPEAPESTEAAEAVLGQAVQRQIAEAVQAPVIKGQAVMAQSPTETADSEEAVGGGASTEAIGDASESAAASSEPAANGEFVGEAHEGDTENNQVEEGQVEEGQVGEDQVKGSDSEALAQDEAPIPTLADRCAAPEATLFPPEPKEPEATEGEEGAGDGGSNEKGDEESGGAMAEAPVGSEGPPESAVGIETTTANSETVSFETANPETANSETANSETVSSETANPETASSKTADLETANPEAASGEASDLDGAADTAMEEPPAEPDSSEAIAVVEPETAIEDLDREAQAEAAAKAAQEKEQVCALLKADQQYQAGQIAEAKITYQLAKDPFAAEAKTLDAEQRLAINEPEALSAGERVFLREAAAGQAQGLETRIVVPLELLVQQHPEFIPGQVQLAEALVNAGRSEEALALLEEASGRYPNEPELLMAHIELASQEGKWMDAVMVARRFAQLNPEHPQAEAFVALAEENMALFQGDVRDRLRANTIANVLTGAVSVALTGSIWNSLSSIQTTAMMLRGEEGVGDGISKSIKRQVELVEDEEVVDYVQTMGEALVAVAGRDEFDYEFNILMDPNLNAFALPGGKIFVNAGAIAKTKSKAELAGLLSHELAHAVLSHGFRLVSDGSLLSDLSRFVPYGGYASNLVVLNYSRDMEREADELGARILASAGYAADGLHGLMKTLGEQDTRKPLFAWMSTHPETDERVENLEEQISREGLERYQFEGVEEHFRMRMKVMRLIEAWEERKAKEEEERPWWR